MTPWASQSVGISNDTNDVIALKYGFEELVARLTSPESLVLTADSRYLELRPGLVIWTHWTQREGLTHPSRPPSPTIHTSLRTIQQPLTLGVASPVPGGADAQGARTQDAEDQLGAAQPAVGRCAGLPVHDRPAGQRPPPRQDPLSAH